jgi:hypothetical protein
MRGQGQCGRLGVVAGAMAEGSRLLGLLLSSILSMPLQIPRAMPLGREMRRPPSLIALLSRFPEQGCGDQHFDCPFGINLSNDTFPS